MTMKDDFASIQHRGMMGDCAARTGAGGPTDLSPVPGLSQRRSSPIAGWQHVLEDGSLDHEWVTEFGVTFCAQCEIQKDYGE